MSKECNCDDDRVRRETKEGKEKDHKDPYSKEALNKLEDDSYMPGAEDIEENIEDMNDDSGGRGAWGGL